MSVAVRVSVAALFGQHERSDCTLVFYRNVGDTGVGSCDDSGPLTGRGNTSDATSPERPNSEALVTDDQTDLAEGGVSADVTAKITDATSGGCDGQLADGTSITNRNQQSAGSGRGASRSPGDSDAVQVKQRDALEPEVPTRLPTESELLPSGCVALGNPIPAHTLVLCCGSQRFRAQVDRWSEGQHKPPHRPLVLRVPLDSEGDLPYARAALQYMYAGVLGTDTVCDPTALLRVRRQAAYLQVDGCAEACEQALLNLIAAVEPTPLAGVARVYGVHELLTRPEEDPELLARVLKACQKQLLNHVAALTTAPEAALPPSGPGLVELLVWAVKDAPSLLSDPEAKQQMRSLPAFAMEALLGCDSLATDDEATVLLIVMAWLEGRTVDSAVRQRLLRLVRLCRVHGTYLFRVLPLMPSWVITAQELRFLQEYAGASDDKRARMREAAAASYDLASGWYRTDSRPAPSASQSTRVYEWCVDATQLKVVVGSEKPDYLTLNGMFTDGNAAVVVSNGFEWNPSVEISCDNMNAVGVYLYCSMPGCLTVTDMAAEGPVLAGPGPWRLALLKGGGGEAGSKEAWSSTFQLNTTVRAGGSRGWPEAIKLSAYKAASQEPSGASTAVQRLERLESYIRDGKLWGSLTFMAE